MTTLILASTSAYRRELLQRLGLPFEACPPNVDETPLHGEMPLETALRLALLKARAVSASRTAAAVIGSDQVADLDGRALGKPGSHDRAVEQLRAMQGRTVVFHTAVAVVCGARRFESAHVESVHVRFRTLTDGEIERYLRLERPYDCAGSAKVEGLGITLLESVNSSDPTTLIGLPLIRTCELLRQVGIDALGTPGQTQGGQA